MGHFSRSCADWAMSRGKISPSSDIPAAGVLRAMHDLARQVVSGKPDVIVAGTNPIAAAVRAATGTIPIVWAGVEGIRDGLAASLARPGGNLTGVDFNDYELWGKRLQILKEAVPSASKIAFLLPHRTWESNGQRLREMGRRLEISLVGMPLDESTPSEYERVFADIAPKRPDAILVHDIGDLLNYRQLIVELVNKIRLPAMYGARATSRFIKRPNSRS